MSVYAIREAERMRDSHAQRRRPMAATFLRGELLIGGCYLIFCRSFDLVKISDQVGSVAEAN